MAKRYRFPILMSMFRYPLLFLFLTAYAVTRAQTSIIDSLKNKLYRTTIKTERLPLLLALAHEQHSLNRDTAYEYAAEAMNLAVNGSSRDKSLAALYFAQSYMPWGWVDSSLAVLEPVLNSNRVSDPATRDLYFLLNRQKAMLNGVHSKYKEALELLYRLIREAEQYKDSVSLGANMNSIGSIALAREHPWEALPWFYKALSVSTHDHRYMPVLTAIYINLANASLAINRYDSSNYYLRKAIPLAEKIENLSLLITALRVQTSVLIKMKRVKEAEISFQAMIDTKRKINSINNVDDNVAIIDFFVNNNQLDKAIELCKEYLKQGNLYATNTSASEMMVNSVAHRLPFYEALARCYKLAGKNELYQQALEQLVLVKDSVYALASTKEIADIQTKYETQIKENAIIEKQRLDIVQKNYRFYGLLGFSLVIAGAGVFSFNEYRRRQRIKMQNALMEEKRMADEAIKKAEEKERIRIAADLHDNLGAYAASMASNLNYLQVDEKNELIRTAFTELKSNSGAMVSELNDTIWVLKKDTLSLTAISDRIKVFISRLRKSYPAITVEITEKISVDHLLSSPQAFHLYRILQEAVNNALKHSQGNLIRVIFTAAESWQVSVTDNGNGMKKADGEIIESNGLINMKRRCEENGWNIQWSVNDDGGTLVTIWPTSN
jgi:signal transduction histidine kinase